MSRSVVGRIATVFPLFLVIGSADAAVQYWGFQVDLISGPYSSNRYSGQFSFTNDGLTGMGIEKPRLNDITFAFAGNTYTKADELNPTVRPTASLLNGVLVNIDYWGQRGLIQFEITSGMAAPSFRYSMSGEVGFGNVRYTQVPEPASPGLLAIGGFALLRRRAA